MLGRSSPASERKLKVIDVARQTGLHRNTITLLYDETASRVDLEAIEKLCALFGVTVGELFEYVPEGTTSENAKQR